MRAVMPGGRGVQQKSPGLVLSGDYGELPFKVRISSETVNNAPTALSEFASLLMDLACAT